MRRPAVADEMELDARTGSRGNCVHEVSHLSYAGPRLEPACEQHAKPLALAVVRALVRPGLEAIKLGAVRDHCDRRRRTKRSNVPSKRVGDDDDPVGGARHECFNRAQRFDGERVA